MYVLSQQTSNCISDMAILCLLYIFVLQTIWTEAMIKNKIPSHKQKVLYPYIFFSIHIYAQIRVCTWTLLLGKSQNTTMNRSKIQIFISTSKHKPLFYSWCLVCFRELEFGFSTTDLHTYLIIVWRLACLWFMYSAKWSEKDIFLF